MNPDALASAADFRPEFAAFAAFVFAVTKWILFPVVQSARVGGRRLPKRLHIAVVMTLLLGLAAAFAGGLGERFFPATSAAFAAGLLAMGVHQATTKKEGGEA